jgi:hypothetical protein
VGPDAAYRRRGPLAAIFPKWTNKTPGIITVIAGMGGVGAVFFVWHFFSPYYLWAGYKPTQPVPYSHRLHAGELGMDCRYCHTGVHEGPKANVPASETCMNCHSVIRSDSPKLEPIREAYAGGDAVEWIKVHGLADYVYFNHSRHVNRGVGCVSCHGRIDQMEVVYQAEPLSMGWCLSCHRAPEKHLRPQTEITNMEFKVSDQEALGLQIKEERNINPPEHCSGCHR